MTGTAPQRLRDLVEALPDFARVEWAAGDRHVYTYRPDQRGDDWLAEAIHSELADLVAAVASPDRVLLLAELLEAIPAWELSAAQGDPWQILADILSARDRFEASLTTEER